MSELHPKISHYLVDSVIEVLGYGDQQRQVVQIAEPDDFDLKQLPLVCMMGIKGEKIQGSLVILCNAQFLRASNPIKEIPAGKDDSYARDWLGEVVNLIMGQLKRKLTNHELTFQVTSPSFQHYVRTSGMALEEFGPKRYEDDGAYKDFWFQIGKMTIVVQLGLKLKSAFQ